MTLTESELSGLDDAGPVPVVADVDGIPVSGLLAESPTPRAVLVALHGGSTRSVYFDCPGHPELSLLRLGRRLGYTVLALDRPGYGRSTPYSERLTTAADRVDLMFGAVAAHLGPRPRGAGVFLVAHSAGCELALRMSVDERGTDLLGLEIAGTGLRHPPLAQRTLWGSGARPSRRPPGLAELLWRPERLYPADVVYGASIAAEGTRLEAGSVLDWADREFPRLARGVRVPVRFSLGEFERVWRNGSADLAEVGALFEAAPRVVLNLQPNSGHNLSVGHTAAAYHLKLLSFAEECLVHRENGEFSGPATQFDGHGQPRPDQTEEVG
ncbi:alpha/beta hydrolase [Nocardia sp. NPDC004068]|uniref:alpha/beta hydrolase n=1 Tax=Nocardia sp. NPDC004068 TaxID=3364303 RepID=UPI0036A1CBB2